MWLFWQGVDTLVGLFVSLNHCLFRYYVFGFKHTALQVSYRLPGVVICGHVVY